VHSPPRLGSPSEKATYNGAARIAASPTSTTREYHGLRLKFNLRCCSFSRWGSLSPVSFYNLLHKNARDEVLRNAGVMMEAALSMRQYTVSQVRDKLGAD